VETVAIGGCPYPLAGLSGEAEVTAAKLERKWFGVRSSDDQLVIVMLHHGIGSVSTWKDFPDRVSSATGLPVLAYSRLGHGKSPPVEPVARFGFMHEAAEHELPGVLEEEGVRRPLLVGHSDGGSITAIYAGTGGRDLVEGCILLAPHVFVEECTVENARVAAENYEQGTLKAGLAVHHDDPDGAFWRWNRSWLESDFLAWNIEAEVSAITCPVAVIQGLDDPYGTVAQADKIEAAVSGSVEKVVLDECGHQPHRDRPAVVLDVITRMSRAVKQ
jgi:pimeloyl-ACP methyl ester carboxylesterase